MCHRPPFPSFLGVLLALAPASALAAPAPSPREAIPFDTGWRFQLGDDPTAKEPGFDDTSWRVLDVPHDWSIEAPFNPPPDGEGSGGYFSHGVGWYRRAARSGSRGSFSVADPMASSASATISPSS